tara:strand:- start:14768 stop:15472 length:705 start_codon:yes stop_codon:yes gene_type:complete
MSKKILAIIPARSGSKGIKNKNIKKIINKPLIYWTIKEAKKSRSISKLIVSTNSKKIKNIALKYNVSVPFLRPEKISNDNSSDYELIIHAINFYKKKNIFFDYVLLLQPTSPLRTSEDIDKLVKYAMTNNLKTLVSFAKVKSEHPNFLFKVKNGKILRYSKQKKSIDTIRQKVKDLYYPEGSIFFSKVRTYLKYKSFYNKETKLYLLPKWKSFEIDDIEDLKFVEQLLKIKKKL